MSDIPTSSSPCRSGLVWTAPRRDQLRVDVDAAFNTDKNLFSVGVVIRDRVGGVVGAKPSIICHPGSMKSAE